jgi:hypothetical protein
MISNETRMASYHPDNPDYIQTNPKTTPYAECKKLCKILGLDEKQLWILRNIIYPHVDVPSIPYFFKALHDFLFTRIKKNDNNEYANHVKIIESGVLKQLYQKCALNHIHHLIGAFLKPVKKTYHPKIQLYSQYINIMICMWKYYNHSCNGARKPDNEQLRVMRYFNIKCEGNVGDEETILNCNCQYSCYERWIDVQTLKTSRVLRYPLFNRSCYKKLICYKNDKGEYPYLEQLKKFNDSEKYCSQCTVIKYDD